MGGVVPEVQSLGGVHFIVGVKAAFPPIWLLHVEYTCYRAGLELTFTNLHKLHEIRKKIPMPLASDTDHIYIYNT